jgi:hypothetical protein
VWSAGLNKLKTGKRLRDWRQLRQKGSRMEGCSMEETAKTYKHFPFCKVCSFFCVLLSILVGFFLCSFHPSVFLRLRDLRGAHVLALSQDEAADIENI